MLYGKRDLAWKDRDRAERKMRAAELRRDSAKKATTIEKHDQEAKKLHKLYIEKDISMRVVEKDMFAAYRVAGPLKDVAAAARLELNTLKVKECICIIKFVCLQVGPLQASSDLHISDWSISKWRKESHEVKALAILKEVKKEGRRSNQKVSQEFMQRVKEAFTASVHST